MTIHNRELSDRLDNLRTCSELAPERTYNEAKRAYAAVDEAIESVRDIIRAAGFVALGDDRCRNLEVAIYGFLLEGNPEAYGLITGEGFGAAMGGPARERVLANTIRDRDFLERSVQP